MPRIAAWGVLGVLTFAVAGAPNIAAALPASGAAPAGASLAAAVPSDVTAVQASRTGGRSYGATRGAVRHGATRGGVRYGVRHAQRPLPRAVPVVRRGGVIAAGRPTERYLRPVPTARAGDTAARRAARQRTPAFTSRRQFLADGRRYGDTRPAQVGGARNVGGTRTYTGTGTGEQHRPRPWRPSQRDLRNIGAVAGAAYAGEVVADDALRGAYDQNANVDDIGSIAVDNRPSRPGRSYSVSSDQAGAVPAYPRSAYPAETLPPAYGTTQPPIAAPTPPALFDTAPPAAPESFDSGFLQIRNGALRSLTARASPRSAPSAGEQALRTATGFGSQVARPRPA